MKKILSFSKVALLGLAIMAAAALAVVVCLTCIGLPAPVVRHYTRALEQEGLQLSFSRVRWRPPYGVVADEARLDPVEGAAFALRARWIGLVLRDHGDSGDRSFRMELQGARLTLSGAAPTLTVEDALADIVVTDTHVAIRRLGGRLPGMARFQCDGSVDMAPTAAGTRPSLAAALQQLADRATRAAATTAPVLRALRHDTAPLVRMHVQADLARPVSVSATLSIKGGPVTVSGVGADEWSAHAAWDDNTLTLIGAQARNRKIGLALHAAGTFRRSDLAFTGTLTASGPPAIVLHAWPGLSTNMRSFATATGPVSARVDFSGTVTNAHAMEGNFAVTASGDAAYPLVLQHAAGSFVGRAVQLRRLRAELNADAPGAFPPLASFFNAVRIEPAKPVQLELFDASLHPQQGLQGAEGQIRCGSLKWRGVTFHEARTAFRWRDGILSLRDGRALTGNAESSVEGIATYEHTTRVWAAAVRTRGNPEWCAPLLPDKIREQARSLQFHGPCYIEAELGGSPQTPQPAVVSATIVAVDIERNEERIDMLRAACSFTNDALEVSSLQAVTGGGSVTGSLAYRTTDQRLSLNLLSTARPATVARLIGPSLTGLLKPYRIEGALQAAVSGIVFPADGEQTDLRIRIDGSQVGWRRILTDRAAMDVRVKGSSVTVTNLSAAWCGGSLTGIIEVANSAGPTPRRITIDITCSDAELPLVVRHLHPVEDRKAYQGRMSGRIRLTGEAGPGFLLSANGEGQVEIREGYLLSIPLLGGLSRYLSVLVPGIGYASQRDFRSNFRIQNGLMETTDAQLLGRLISVQGKGNYSLADSRMDVRVQVLFLKEGLTATVTRLLTSPLTRALEFQLTGTPREPQWRPSSLPDGLLKFFEGKPALPPE